MTKKVGICKFCGKETELVNAHIIPRYFYKEKALLKDLTTRKTSTIQKGSYDSNILCSECDNHIFGRFDQEAKRVFIDKIQNHKETIGKDYIIYHLGKDDFNYDLIRKFFISVLWRASVSTRPEFKDISLGQYENIAKDIINGNNQFADFFKIFFYKIQAFDIEYKKGMYKREIPPIGENIVFIMKHRIENLFSYRVFIAGYDFFIVVNGKDLHNETKIFLEKTYNKDNLYIYESREIYLNMLDCLKKAVDIFEKTKKW